MDETRMRRVIDSVLEELTVQQLEQRVAPVKCEKQPDAPECQAVSLYGTEAPGECAGGVCRYGIGY